MIWRPAASASRFSSDPGYKKQVAAAYESGAAAVELHTGELTPKLQGRPPGTANRKCCVWRRAKLMREALKFMRDTALLMRMSLMSRQSLRSPELNIGHALVAEASFVGFEQSVRNMRRLMNKAR